LPVIERLKTRFLIARIRVVADRGMISAATLGELETRNIDYILGVRERATKEIGSVIADPAPYVPLSIPKAAGRGSTDLLVKEVFRSGLDAGPAPAEAGGKPGRRRYIVSSATTRPRRNRTRPSARPSSPLSKRRCAAATRASLATAAIAPSSS
jgi:hypothetical protein